MEVLVFHQHFKLHTQAGSARMRNVCSALRDRGHGVTVITGSSCRSGAEEISNASPITKHLLYHEFEYLSGIKVISLPDFYDQKRSVALRVLSFLWFSLLAFVVPLFRYKDDDIYFASSTPLTITIPAILMSKLRRKPFAFEVRDLWPDGPIQMGFLKNRFLILLARVLERASYGNADLVIVHTKGVARIIETRCDARVVKIPIGVDDLFFESEKRSKVSVNKDKFKVVYAGACGFNNAIEVLFSVAKKSSEDPLTKNTVQFIIIGDGPALEGRRSNLPLNMTLMGKMPKYKAIEILQESDVALFSQRKVTGGNFKNDVVGNKYFDFLGAKLPIIMGSVPQGEMALEVIENRCGIVSPPEDVASLFGGIKRIYSDPALRGSMSEASGRVALIYRQSDMMDRFCEELESIVH